MKRLILISAILFAFLQVNAQYVYHTLDNGKKVQGFGVTDSTGALVSNFSVDPLIQLSLGNIPGQYTINKFGAAIDGVQTTATDIWDGADAAATQQIWVAPVAARKHNIVSTSANDDADPAGSGAQAVQIWGLTSWATPESSEIILLNSTDSVPTINDYVIIHRMKVIENDSTYNINAGDITATTTFEGTKTAIIQAGEGQTLMAIYGIPSTKTALITSFYLNIHDNANPSTAADIDFKLLMNERPDLNPLTFLNKHSGGSVSLGSSNIQIPFKPYKMCSGPCIIKLQATGSVADLYTSAGFNLILIDN